MDCFDRFVLSTRTNQLYYYCSDDSKGEYDSGSHKGKCWLIPELTISKEVQDYFQSDEWNDVIYWDVVLHKAANRVLGLDD